MVIIIDSAIVGMLPEDKSVVWKLELVVDVLILFLLLSTPYWKVMHEVWGSIEKMVKVNAQGHEKY